ncbi:potassium-transporting ATPase subunit B, partial [Paenibacillus sepulcri]|nr:potassium-transporting ATPase subunit B [Paenibacillus sepulcri]
MSAARNRKTMLTPAITQNAVKESFIKLNPAVMIKNPVMFVVEIGTVVVLLMTIIPGYFGTGDQIGFNLTVFLILLFTLLFANFAEALAEGRGKAQADSLKKSKQEIMANKLVGGSTKTVNATELRKG